MSSPRTHHPRQVPLGSGFGVASTATEVLGDADLTGRTAIVTGGASGIGVETVRALRSAGAQVVVPARDVARARTTLAGIAGDGLDIEPMDLMDPASIDAFAARFTASGRPLHLLVASAGIGGAPLLRDARGHESHFATNHLGHFQLVGRLWPALRRAADVTTSVDGGPGVRVVVVSSWAHRHSDVVLDDPDYERRPYDPQTAYGQSKTANVLFAMTLDERVRDHGVRAFSLHPGTIVDTNFKRNVPDGILEAAGMVDAEGRAVIDPAMGWKSVEQGAATSVWCAVSPQLDGLGGVYAQDCDVAPLLDHTDPDVVAAAQRWGPAGLGVMDYALDPATAERLWTLSEELTGVTGPA
jgi:NAD(P)-dependent dehydrogenase (short-subunit alcohol dehydrogenase family)